VSNQAAKGVSTEVAARVDAIQARIAAAGVKGFSFTKDPEKWNALTFDQRAAEICAVLEAYLDGKCKPIPGYLPWRDAGYLGNGHCSFMRKDGWSCTLSHGHDGLHVPLGRAPR
jgi:hypothetical protein